MENQKNKRSLWRLIKKHVKVKDIIILIILLTANTYAWFIFSTNVNTSMDVHIAGWEVVFTDDGNPVSDIININVTDVYPGMPDYSKSITTYNYGDVEAISSYEVLSARIFDDEYISAEGKLQIGEELDGTEISSDELIEKLENDYPFSITMLSAPERLEPLTGTSNFVARVVWLYESGNDELDTEWGKRAYDYKLYNPSSSSIELQVRIKLTQAGS